MPQPTDAHPGDSSAAAPTAPRRPAARGWLTGISAVTAGSMVANIAAYLLHIPAGRWLGPAAYGEFASLLAAQLALAVPALALQSVVARQMVLGSDRSGQRALGLRCVAIVAVLAAISAPILTVLLHTSATAAIASVMMAPVLVLLATEQGILQGQSRFGELALVIAGAGLAKVVPAVVVLAAGGSPGPALIASAAGLLVATVAARLVVDLRAARHGRDVDAGRSAGSLRAVLAASQVQLVIVALSSLDLVVVRAVVDREQAGLYALGAVAAKVAFWLPQAIGLVAYPRLADPGQARAALRSALGGLVGIGVLVVGAAAVAAPLASVVVGAAYQPVEPLLWVFALQGAALAVLQVALLSAIARGRTRLAAVAWCAAAIELTLIATLAQTATGTITIAAATAVITAAITATVALLGAGTR